MKINNNEELLKTLSIIQFDFNAYFGFILNSMTYFQLDSESLENSDKVKYALSEIKNIKNVLNKYEKLLDIKNEK